MNRVISKDFGSMVPGLRHVSCKVTTTTSGTVSGTTATGFGMKITKTAGETGRYTCQLIGNDGTAQDALEWCGGAVAMVGPDDNALTDAKGLDPIWRDIDIGAGAADGTIEVQFVDADSGADTEV